MRKALLLFFKPVLLDLVLYVCVCVWQNLASQGKKRGGEEMATRTTFSGGGGPGCPGDYTHES